MGYWAVARTLAKREAFAADRLEAAGFEVFAPKTRVGRGEAALFPGYLFVHIADHWRAIDRTLGVLGLIKVGDAPARCPDAEIAAIRSRTDSKGFVRVPGPMKAARRRKLRPGAKVRIGALEGIYAGQTARERELVLIDLLGRQLAVELRPGQLADPVHLAAVPRLR